MRPLPSCPFPVWLGFTGAGLFLRPLNLQSVDIGFNPNNILVSIVMSMSERDPSPSFHFDRDEC